VQDLNLHLVSSSLLHTGQHSSCNHSTQGLNKANKSSCCKLVPEMQVWKCNNGSWRFLDRLLPICILGKFKSIASNGGNQLVPVLTTRPCNAPL
jgi:hypothetical protein